MRDFPPMEEYLAVSARLKGVSAARVSVISGHPGPIVECVRNQTRMVSPEQLRDINRALDLIVRPKPSVEEELGELLKAICRRWERNLEKPNTRRMDRLCKLFKDLGAE